MYVCGPTVYNHRHIGNAKSHTTFAVLVRYLIKYGYRAR
ncbi:MAG: hypothetical protein KJ645_07710 [Planctomycetes bacterium]|nr:hypothetical protein [Planctomycetota bacterium]